MFIEANEEEKNYGWKWLSKMNRFENNSTVRVIELKYKGVCGLSVRPNKVSEVFVTQYV